MKRSSIFFSKFASHSFQLNLNLIQSNFNQIVEFNLIELRFNSIQTPLNVVNSI